MKILVKNRSGHNMSHMGPYLKSFLPYAQKRMGFNRPPTIFFDSDPQNAENVLGKTAYYNPETEEIVVFVDKRHPKDILRSLSHELVHHSQNCRGDLDPEIAGETTPGYAQTNAHMRAMEGEAYLKGNGFYFRDWEDSLKNQLEETNYKHITGDSHKMATYEQLKEEITTKVVAALTEKLKGKQHKIASAAPPEDEITGADFKALQKKESVEEINEEEEELEERKKRDTPRDSDRREDVKLKVNEKKHKTEPELEPQVDKPKAKDAPPEELEEYGSLPPAYAELSGYDSQEQMDAAQAREEEAERRRKAKKAKTPGKTLEEDEEVVEETTSNDEWYQNELFESLTKRWTK